MQRHPLVILCAAGLFVAASLLAYTYYYYSAPGPLAETQTVLFKRGMGFEDIVDRMAEQGVITRPLLFKAVAVVSGSARKFKAGEYRFSAAISPRLIIDMIAHGRVVVHKITVAEGLNVRQVIELLSKQELLEGVVALRADEGSLLPQTYHYVYGDQRQELINRMQQAMRSTLDELWAKRAADVPLKTPEEALTLASIVEKETGVAEERGRVAAVFINRLKKGMKLQTDPTVIYALEQQSGKPLGRALTLKDLQIDSPYNTYRNPGLPPGPIANPGRGAIEAVLNPPKTNELYFVATGNGGHYFSETLSAHNDNVKTYKNELKKQKAQASQPVTPSE